MVGSGADILMEDDWVTTAGEVSSLEITDEASMSVSTEGVSVDFSKTSEDVDGEFGEGRQDIVMVLTIKVGGVASK